MKKKVMGLLVHTAIVAVPGAVSLLVAMLDSKQNAIPALGVAVMIVREVDHTFLTPYLEQLGKEYPDTVDPVDPSGAVEVPADPAPAPAA